MKVRCQNPNFKKYNLYGGRGIRVCDEWQNFEGFYEDMADGYKDGLTIDRIDSNGDYCKENCRWTTFYVQSNNRSCNHAIIHNNKTQNLTQWAREYNMAVSTLSNRLKRGWTVEDALTKPVKQYKR